MIDYIDKAEKAVQMGDNLGAIANALIAIAVSSINLVILEDIALNLEAVEEEDEE